MRVMVKYARYDGASYLSHLDMQRAFARILRRSGLPVLYSQGFNPHIIMSFASPLSVGYETDGDYMEFKLDGDPDTEEIKLAICRVLPDNIKVSFVGRIAEDTKKLMSLNSSADYELTFEHDITEQWNDFFGKEVCMCADRKGREIDARSFVLDGSANGNVLKLHLKNSSEACLNPAVIGNMFVIENEKVLYKRTECYAETAAGDKPFSELAGQ